MLRRSAVIAYAVRYWIGRANPGSMDVLLVCVLWIDNEEAEIWRVTFWWPSSLSA